MVYTKRDLLTMQGWPLSRKIQVTQTKILEWHAHFDGKVCVSFSGGKDSTVLLDLARRVDPGIPAVFVDTGMEYPEIRAFVKDTPNVDWVRPEKPFNSVIREHGYPVISKDVSRIIRYARQGSSWAQLKLIGCNSDGTPSKFCQRYMKHAHLVDAPFAISDQCCDYMKKRPLHRYHKETGSAPIVGTMACESARREAAYMQTGCNSLVTQKSQPLSFWTEQDILAYIQMMHIPYASIYGDIIEVDGKLKTTGATRTGCMFCMFGVHLEKQPNRFQRMHETHPQLHDYCIHKLGCGQVLDHIGVPYT